MYEKCCEIIYEMIAKRVSYKRKVMQLTNEDIFPDDVNIVSAIANNRKHNKKNPYLLPGGNRLDSSTGETISIIGAICDSLSFESPIELILGTEEELDSYAGYLFKHILCEASNDSDSDTKEMIETLLCDYIPYAIADFFFEADNDVLFIPKPILEYHDETDDMFIDDIFYERDCAIARLFITHKEAFVSGIKKIFEKQGNTTKINKRLAKYVSKELVPYMFQKREPYLLSANTISMLNETRNINIQETNRELLISTVYSDPYHNEHTELISIADDLAEANISYVGSLAKIQEKYEGIPSPEVLMNKWKPYMCL